MFVIRERLYAHPVDLLEPEERRLMLPASNHRFQF